MSRKNYIFDKCCLSATRYATICRVKATKITRYTKTKINNPKDYFAMYKANKKSPHYYASHSSDIYTELGYDYHNGTILSNTLSPVILKNKKNKAMLSNVERIICYMSILMISMMI